MKKKTTVNDCNEDSEQQKMNEMILTMTVGMTTVSKLGILTRINQKKANAIILLRQQPPRAFS